MGPRLLAILLLGCASTPRTDALQREVRDLRVRIAEAEKGVVGARQEADSLRVELEAESETLAAAIRRQGFPSAVALARLDADLLAATVERLYAGATGEVAASGPKPAFTWTLDDVRARMAANRIYVTGRVRIVTAGATGSCEVPVHGHLFFRERNRLQAGELSARCALAGHEVQVPVGALLPPLTLPLELVERVELGVVEGAVAPSAALVYVAPADVHLDASSVELTVRSIQVRGAAP